MNRTIKVTLYILFGITLLNYLAQIPYAIHLYHGRINPVGFFLLFITCIWFLCGFGLLMKRNRSGFWVLLSFLFIEFFFYFHNEIVLSFFGYGMLYHFTHSKDLLLWIVFFIGDINFLTAGYYCYYLLRNKSRLV